MDHLRQHLLVVVVLGSTSSEGGSGSSAVVKDQQEVQAVALVVAVWFLEVVVTIQHRPHREEALLIVIGQATRPVPVSVPKLVRRPLGLVVLLVTARLFVVHITLQQDHPLLLLPSQALPLKKGILQQAQSVIISTSSHQADAAHCDQTGYPSCYSIGFEGWQKQSRN